MRNFKILFLMLIGVFWLNSCATLATAAAVTYLGGTALVYACAEYPDSFFCNPLPERPETPEEEAKRKEKERKKQEQAKIDMEKKEIQEKNYIQSVILRKRENTEVFENISILMPEGLEFRRVKEPMETDFGNMLSVLYDKEKKSYFPKKLVVFERGKKNFEKIVNNGKDENYEEYYKKQSEEYIDKQIKYYEKKLAEYPLDEYYKNNLKEYKEKKGKSFNISTNVEKIGDNAYKITEKINNFGSSQVKTTYVKILKEGVYIIGDNDTKDIFEGIFKN